MGFYNTTNEQGHYLKTVKNDTEIQDKRIYSVFIAYGGEHSMFSAWAIQEMIGNSVPITSIRRSLNTLTKEGMLEKTKIKVKGPYGRPCYCWKLNKIPG